MTENELQEQQNLAEPVQPNSQPTISSDMINDAVKLPYVEKFIEEKPIKYNNVAGALLLALGLFTVASGIYTWFGTPKDVSGLSEFIGGFIIAVGIIFLFLSLITALFAKKAAIEIQSEYTLLAALPIEGLQYQLKKASKKALIYFAFVIVCFALNGAMRLLPETYALSIALLTMSSFLAGIFLLIVSLKYFFKAIKISRRIKASQF